MSNLDAPIYYNFPWSWSESCLGRKPVINPLMKAIIEQNISEMYSLINRGAKIEALDRLTLQKTIWYHIKNIKIFQFFIDNGARGYYQQGYFVNDKISRLIENCVNDHRDGYSAATVAWAYYCGAYDVFELLLSNGYFGKNICFDGAKNQSTDLIKVIFERNDVNTIKMLMEYGCPRSEIDNGYNAYHYSDNPCYQYVMNNIVYHRKSYVINPRLIYPIGEPILEKPGWFNRKKIQARNDALVQDYRDQVRVQKEFMDSLSPEQKQKLSQYLKDKPKMDKLTYDTIKNMLNNK